MILQPSILAVYFWDGLVASILCMQSLGASIKLLGKKRKRITTAISKYVDRFEFVGKSDPPFLFPGALSEVPWTRRPRG